MNCKSFDENESSWLEGIYDSLCDFFAFFFGDVVKDCQSCMPFPFAAVSAWGVVSRAASR
jgi:hypothetical protein